jgi:ABC-type antimicrobial peptide transport system permease subunit
MWAGHVKTALANLRASRFRSFLTMFGIIIGVSSVITLVSLGEGLKHQVVGQVSRLGGNVLTVRPGKLVSGSGDKQTINLLALFSASTLTDGDVSSLDKIGSLQRVVPVNFVASSAKSDSTQLDNISIIGTRPGLADMLSLKSKYGDFLTDQTSNTKVAVVGEDVANKFFNVINPVGHSVTISGQTFIVRGVLSHVDTGVLAAAQTDFNSAVIIPYEVSKDIAAGKTNILQILAQAKDGSNVDSAITDMRNKMSQAHGGSEDFTILKQAQLLKLVNGVIGNATNFITAIAAISLLVGGIGIMDIMLASVAERTREIGIRKAIGATNRQILVQFFTEGLMLSVGGGFMGIILALIATQALKLYTSLPTVINIYVIILAVTVSISIGVIFSIIPALKAARKEPIDALRG